MEDKDKRFILKKLQLAMYCMQDDLDPPAHEVIQNLLEDMEEYEPEVHDVVVIFYQHGTLPSITLSWEQPNGSTKRLRFINQNPNKEYKPGLLTNYAKLAREGMHITWVIDIRKDEYLGSIQNGEWVGPSQPKKNFQHHSATA